MLARMSHTRLLRFAGLLTWAMAGCWLLTIWLDPVNASGLTPAERLAFNRSIWFWISAYLTFGTVYWLLTRSLGGERKVLRDHGLLLILAISAIATSYFSNTGLGSILVMVVAVLLPWLFSVRVGAMWLLCSNFAMAPVFVLAVGMPLQVAVIQSLVYVGFSGFVFITSLVALQQSEAREEQRRLNAELRSTRALLAESARINERTRISRELHDLLGHHLTALSLNLEVAVHLSEGRVKEHVQQAHTLARLLLTDVREAVSQLRDSGAIDLGAALRPLAENVPKLAIHMQIQQPLTVEDPERAHVLLRCAQEAITNAVRHADARNLWLDAGNDGRQITLRVRDDGSGSDHLTHGNGLQGMQERLHQFGGQLRIETRAGHGFQLTMILPTGASADAVIPQGVAA